jgi:hypothetical protein
VRAVVHGRELRRANLDGLEDDAASMWRELAERCWS